MAVKTLVVEVDQSTTRVIEMDYASKKPVVYNFFTFATPLETTRDGAVRVNEDFVMTFKNLYSFNNMTAKQVLFLLSSSRIASRDVEIPHVPDKQIQGVLEGSFTDYFPVDPEQYHFVYKILRRNNAETGKTIELNMLSIPNDLTAGYFELSHALGLELVNICYVGNSSLLLSKIMAGEFVYISPLQKSLSPILSKVNLEKLKKPKKDSVDDLHNVQSDGSLIVGEDEYDDQTPINAVVKIEAYSSFVTIINNGEAVLQRAVQSGFSELLELVRSHTEFGEDITQTDALKVLRENTLVYNTFRENRDMTNPLTVIKMELTNSLRSLITSISRVIEFYTSRNQNTYVKDVILTGAGATITGLANLFQNELGFEVQTVDEFPKLVFAHTKGKTVKATPDVSAIPTQVAQPEEKEQTFSLNDLDSMLTQKQQEDSIENLKTIQSSTDNQDADSKATIPDAPEKEEFNPHLFALLIASGLSEDGIVTEAEKFGDAQAATARKERKIVIFCSVGAAVLVLVALGLFGYSQWQKHKAIDEKTKVEKQIAEYEAQNVEGVFAQYQAERSKTASLKDILAATHSPNENLVAFIEELEEKIPQDTVVESLIATEQGVTLNFIAGSKVSAAKTLLQLKTFASAEMVSSASLTDSYTYIEQPENDRAVAFAVSFVYKNVPFDVDGYLEEQLAKEDSQS